MCSCVTPHVEKKQRRADEQCGAVFARRVPGFDPRHIQDQNHARHEAKSDHRRSRGSQSARAHHPKYPRGPSEFHLILHGLPRARWANHRRSVRRQNGTTRPGPAISVAVSAGGISVEAAEALEVPDLLENSSSDNVRKKAAMATVMASFLFMTKPSNQSHCFKRV